MNTSKINNTNPADEDSSDLLFKNDFYEQTAFDKINSRDQKANEIEFSNCSFTNSVFIKGVFNNCRFDDCSFNGCDFSLSSFRDCSFFGAEFKDCKLIGIDWTKIRKPFKINFSNCKLNDSILFNMDLRNIEILNCEAHNVDFEKANLTKAKLSNSDFNKSNFTSANLASANLTGALNYKIDPNSCNIKNAKFSLPEVLSLLAQWNIIIE